MNKVNVTLVVITKNEQDNIEKCLKSAYGWADEIIVVDDESTDNTVKLAQIYADKIFFRKMDNEGRHRNWAYQQARNEWVISIDADEYLTDELKNEIAEALKADTNITAYSIPLRNFIGSYQVRYSGWYPANKLRMFQKSKFRYEEVGVHPRGYLEGLERKLTKDIVHKGYPTFEHFLASLNRQTTLEAEKWINDGRNMTFFYALRRSIGRFFSTMIMKKGYKDGFIGFMIAYFASLYQIMSYAKYWQIKRERNIS